jgi:hypothetical protein
MGKEVEAFVWCKEGADVAEGGDDGFEGLGSDAAEVGFQLCEGHLDRVEIGAVGGQWQEPAAVRPEDFGGTRAAMDGKVVQDDGRAGCQSRGKLGLDPGIEGGAVHRARDHPWCDQVVTGQPGDECLGGPAYEGPAAGQALSFRSAPAQPGQARPDGGFIHKDKAMGHLPHQALPSRPIGPRPAKRRPVTLGCDQAFFYMSARMP